MKLKNKQKKRIELFVNTAKDCLGMKVDTPLPEGMGVSTQLIEIEV